MKARHYIPILLLLAAAIIGIYLVASQPAKCTPREDDPDGYLFKICSYIKDNNLDVSPADPTKYHIIRIEDGHYEQQEVLIIYLDCCYMGDRAFVDRETKEIVNFGLGPK